MFPPSNNIFIQFREFNSKSPEQRKDHSQSLKDLVSERKEMIDIYKRDKKLKEI